MSDNHLIVTPVEKYTTVFGGTTASPFRETHTYYRQKPVTPVPGTRSDW